MSAFFILFVILNISRGIGIYTIFKLYQIMSMVFDEILTNITCNFIKNIILLI
jgi:hypothetical protein